MERINFTSQVMGPIGRRRLKKKLVTQTLRSESASIVQSVKSKLIKDGDPVGVYLNSTLVGEAKLVSCNLKRSTGFLDIDAQLGGFDNIGQMVKALKRAGYRFMEIGKYRLYRVKFEWS